MIVLTGSSLNKRHEELNLKVNKAAESNLNFEELKETNESSDVDKLFKIDLASKYKKIDYILEVLMSGDSLYVSRALQCDWITNDEFGQFINPRYLDQNIFPLMSAKIKKKLLSSLSTRIRNGERAEEFYHYCMRKKMNNLGMSFLLYTSESFKIKILTSHPHVYNDFDRTIEYLERFIGNSFLLADYYLNVLVDGSRSIVLNKLRYLYSVSQDQYLDLIEKFRGTDHHHQTSLRLSRDIMKKHKKRVLKDPWLYLNMINHEVVTKYSTIEDAKVYAISFLPDEGYAFWYNDYYKTNEYFLKLIPLGERFSFVKKIFTEKYPDVEFEDDYNFFRCQSYEMMTEQEKEDWALRHIASDREWHGSGNDYIWYQFVNFNKAFVELKKYILIALDSNKRLNILKILIDSAKTQGELTMLLEYYYNRHINEMKNDKRDFLNKLIDNHNVLDFTDECWAALEKIFYSLDVYYKLSGDNNDYQNDHYRVVSLTYYIIHEKSIPEVFYDYVIMGTITISDMAWSFQLDSEKKYMIFQYLLRCFTNHVETLLKGKTETEDINKFIFYILDLIVALDKTLEYIPKNINEHMLLDFEVFNHHEIFAREQKPFSPPPPPFRISDIMHYLKEDASLVVSKFPTIREFIEEKKCKNNINWLIRKLKIYFSNDIAPEYIKLLNECLSVEELYLQTARVAVYGFFYLSEEEYKIDFLKKYVPVDSKIDHVNISRNLLTIQMAICSVACHSRPPLPLSSFRDYIKGDYLQYCIYIFDSYLSNLMPDQCLTFVESLLDSPVSVQKHGIRLAFHCFSTDNLKNLVLKVWKKMKNVSLRKILYKALFEKVRDYDDNLIAQWKLFGVLTIMTHDLHQDDDEEIFELLTRELPTNLFGQHLQSAYIVVSTFPKRTINYHRLALIVQAMENNLELISKNVLLGIMEEHMNVMLDRDLILNTNLTDGHYQVIYAKWSLIKTVIIKHKNMHIVYLLMDKFIEKWHKTDGDEYIFRRHWAQFVNDIERLSYCEQTSDYLDINNIFHTILADIEGAFPLKETYIAGWKLKLSILTRQVLGEIVLNNEENDSKITEKLAKETILKFSKQVGNLMKEYIDTKKYFTYFHNEIENLIGGVIDIVLGHVNRFIDKNISVMDINTLLCSVLLEYDVREMYIFVMYFIPKDYYYKFTTEYFNVIDKLKSLGDDEIEYFMCHKFTTSDLRFRKFMQ